ncbi:PH domain-containing protein [Nonomuraea mangrovi]|uniref:PH domain-containing protein n=1 Tax=Nonomuraea mangrovi TaxID=2316207 RepID=A0ABW4TB33_9ACTN
MTTHQGTESGVRWSTLHHRIPLANAALSTTVAAPAAFALTRFLLDKDIARELVIACAAGTVALVLVAGYVYGVARLRTTRFRLTPDRLELRAGILVRQHRSIPRDRVRSVDVKADVVRRALGLAVVKVGTGEHTTGEHTELTLNAMAAPDAEALRRTLLTGAGAATPGHAAFSPALAAPSTLTVPSAPSTLAGPSTLAAPGPPFAAGAEHEESGQAVATLRWSWIRYAPLSIWVFVGGAIAIGAIKKVLDVVGIDLFSTSAAKVAWEWLVGNPWVAIPVVLAVSLLVGLVGAVGLFAESWGNYRLEQEARTLRVRRGLLTTRSLTMETRRLRGVTVAEPLLLRLGGGAKVRVVAVGLRKAEGQESEEVSALTPPVPRAEAFRVASHVLHAASTPAPATHPTPAPALAPTPTPASASASASASGHSAHTRLGSPESPGSVGSPGSLGSPGSDGSRGHAASVPGEAVGEVGWGQLAPHPRAARGRRTRQALLMVAVLAAAMGITEWLTGWIPLAAWALPALALPAALALAADAYRGLGHRLSGGHLLTRAGSAGRTTVALDTGGIVGWRIRQSFFQRRLGLITVAATTAAGDGHYDVLDVGTAEGLDLAARAVPGLLGPFLVQSTGTRRQG